MNAEKPINTARGCIHQASVRDVAPNPSCWGIVTVEAMIADGNDFYAERQRSRKIISRAGNLGERLIRYGRPDYRFVTVRTADQRSRFGRSIWIACHPALRGPSTSFRESSPTLRIEPGGRRRISAT
jgi:hypothetical protein